MSIQQSQQFSEISESIKDIKGFKERDFAIRQRFSDEMDKNAFCYRTMAEVFKQIPRKICPPQVQPQDPVNLVAKSNFNNSNERDEVEEAVEPYGQNSYRFLPLGVVDTDGIPVIYRVVLCTDALVPDPTLKPPTTHDLVMTLC